MAEIHVNFTHTIRKMKPLHGGGQPAVSSTGYSDFSIFSEIGVPYSRLHDVEGAFGGGKYVDIPNIFRDFDADENDPSSYDFTFTDRLIEDLMKAGIEPYFRLGVTIENAAKVKTYWIDPPADYEKWARICEHIISHYLLGWANGYHYRITYWEIWNEPDNLGSYSEYGNNQMWKGTAEEYYRLYDITAKHLKQKFPEIQIGGYGSCGFYLHTADPGSEKPQRMKEFEYYISFFRGFLRYVKEHQSPLDFFSWHSYTNVKKTLAWVPFLKKELASAGFENLPTHLNEWNPYAKERGTAHHGAEVAAMMLAMQNQPEVALMCIYDMRMFGIYAPLFDSMKEKPTYAYYALAAFNRLFQLGYQVESVCDTDGLYVVAATDGTSRAIMIANLTGEKQQIEIKGADLKKARFYILDDGRLLSWAANADRLDANSVALIEF